MFLTQFCSRLFFRARVFLYVIALFVAFSPRIYAYKVVDAANQSFEFSTPPKVISLTPSTTEIICELNSDEYLLGVSAFCSYPKSLKKFNSNADKIALTINSKEKIGTFFSPNYERILSLKPDLVILPNSVEHTARDKFKSLAIPVFLLYPDGLDNILKNVEMLGSLFQKSDLAKQKIDEFNSKIPQRSKLPNDAKRAIIIFDNGYTANTKSFAGELIERLGYKNVADEKLPMWFVPQKEFILMSDPDVIFIVTNSMENFEKEKLRLQNNPIWNPKKIQKTFIYIEQDLILIPALRIQNIKGANTK